MKLHNFNNEIGSILTRNGGKFMEQNSNHTTQENSKKQFSKYIWMIVFVLVLLIAVSAGFFVSKLKNVTPTDGEDVIALVPEDGEEETGESNSPETDSEENVTKIDVPKSSGAASKKGGQTATRQEKRQVGLQEAEMTVEDERQVWKTETEIDIFDKYYKGTKEAGTRNEITVENGGYDDMNLIAPGTENTYIFWVKNTGQVGIDYTVTFEEHQKPIHTIPLEVRVKCGDTYLLGKENQWVSIHELDDLTHEGHLSVKHYAQYSLEWRWPFEIDEAHDEFDTSLGDLAVTKNLEQEIIIRTYGEGYDRPIYEMFSVAGVKTGDAANTFVYIILMLAAIAVLVLLFVFKKKKDEDKEEEKEVGEKKEY